MGKNRPLAVCGRYICLNTLTNGQAESFKRRQDSFTGIVDGSVRIRLPRPRRHESDKPTHGCAVKRQDYQVRGVPCANIEVALAVCASAALPLSSARRLYRLRFQSSLGAPTEMGRQRVSGFVQFSARSRGTAVVGARCRTERPLVVLAARLSAGKQAAAKGATAAECGRDSGFSKPREHGPVDLGAGSFGRELRTRDRRRDI
jgi:hypothetical protein